MLIYANGSKHMLSLEVRNPKSDSYIVKKNVVLQRVSALATHQGLRKSLNKIVTSFLPVGNAHEVTNVPLSMIGIR